MVTQEMKDGMLAGLDRAINEGWKLAVVGAFDDQGGVCSCVAAAVGLGWVMPAVPPTTSTERSDLENDVYEFLEARHIPYGRIYMANDGEWIDPDTGATLQYGGFKAARDVIADMRVGNVKDAA